MKLNWIHFQFNFLFKTFIKVYIIYEKGKIMEKKYINNAHIARKFKEYREKSKLTQSQVAELIDVEPKQISMIETGFSKGSIDTLINLCNIYRITPDVVLYDLLDDKIKDSVSIYDEKFKKLDEKDKNIILHLMDYLLESYDKN